MHIFGRIIGYIGLMTLSVILVSSVTAQRRSYITDANKIYLSCMRGYIATADIAPTAQDIKEFINNANEQCIAWMLIWYSPITGDMLEIQEWHQDDVSKLNMAIQMTMYNIDREMKMYLGVK